MCGIQDAWNRTERFYCYGIPIASKMEDLSILQESIQKFDVPCKMGYDSKDRYEYWEYVHFEMKSKRFIVIPWSMPDLSGEQHNLVFAVKSILVSELNKDNVLFGRKPCKKQ